MYKAIVCDGKDQVCKFLENMLKLGYNPKMQVISITQYNNFYTIFYDYIEYLGEPSYYE